MAYISKFTGAQIDALLDASEAMKTRKEDVANKVTSINADATDEQYPSAKAVKFAIDAKTEKLYDLGSEVIAIDFWHTPTKSPFSIVGYRSKVTGKVNTSRNDYRTTPLIHLSTFLGAHTDGIKIKSGTIRTQAAITNVCTFFDADKSFLSAGVSTGTFSNASGIPSSEIPDGAYYIAFSRYIGDGASDVVFANVGIDSIEDAINKNKESIVNNSQKIEKASANINRQKVDLEHITGSSSTDFTISSQYAQIGILYPTVEVGAVAVASKGSAKLDLSIVIPVNQGDVFEITSRMDSSQSWMVVDNDYIVVQKPSISGLVYKSSAKISKSNAAYLIVSHAGTADYPQNYMVVHREAIAGTVDKAIILKNSFPGLSKLNLTNGSVDGDEVVFNLTTSARATYNLWSQKAGDVLYVSAYLKTTQRTDNLFIQDGDGKKLYSNTTSGSGEYEFISLTARLSDEVGRFYTNFDGLYQNREIRLKDILFVNLTAVFGAGNEPTQNEMDIIAKMMNIPIEGVVVSKLDNMDVFNGVVKKEADNNDGGITAAMTKGEFIAAINSAFVGYATLCNCDSRCFIALTQEMTPEKMYQVINDNFRRDVLRIGMSSEEVANAINRNLKIPTYRFADAKIGSLRDVSLSTGMQADEPSVICSPDGNTMYIYAHLQRIETSDGIHWSEPVNTPIDGEYIMHNNVSLIDGVYYMIGTPGNGSDLLLYTSDDGINFTYRGVIFTVGHLVNGTDSVASFGNTALHKDSSSGTYYLFYEHSYAKDGLWRISMATCQDVTKDNGDGTIGDWVDNPSNPIIGVKYIVSVKDLKRLSIGAGNPDFAKLSDNRPVRSNGYYYIYLHGTSGGQSLIYRAKSKDLVDWEEDGFVLDNRDEPSAGDNTSGNADHCIIEFKGRTYLFYTWNINTTLYQPYIKYQIDDRPIVELLKLRP